MKKVTDFIEKEHSPLQNIIAKQQDMTSLETLLQKLLTEAEQPHVWISNFRNNVLVLGADTGAWLTKLRYRQLDLLAGFREHYPQLKNISLAIQKPPAASAPLPKEKHREQPNSTVLASLESTAEHLTSSALKKSLYRLLEQLGTKK